MSNIQYKQDSESQSDLLSIIKAPLLTEKMIRLIEQNQYSFAVDANATKTSVKVAIEKLFDVKEIEFKWHPGFAVSQKQKYPSDRRSS